MSTKLKGVLVSVLHTEAEVKDHKEAESRKIVDTIELFISLIFTIPAMLIIVIGAEVETQMGRMVPNLMALA